MACHREDCFYQLLCEHEDGCDCLICKPGSWTVEDVLIDLAENLSQRDSTYDRTNQADGIAKDLLIRDLEMTARGLDNLRYRLVRRAELLKRRA